MSEDGPKIMHYIFAKAKGIVHMRILCDYNVAIFITFQSTISYLVWWSSEDKVSIHNDTDLKEPGSKEQRITGAFCTVWFGHKLYKAGITSVGK